MTAGVSGITTIDVLSGNMVPYNPQQALRYLGALVDQFSPTFLLSISDDEPTNVLR